MVRKISYSNICFVVNASADTPLRWNEAWHEVSLYWQHRTCASAISSYNASGLFFPRENNNDCWCKLQRPNGRLDRALGLDDECLTSISKLPYTVLTIAPSSFDASSLSWIEEGTGHPFPGPENQNPSVSLPTLGTEGERDRAPRPTALSAYLLTITGDPKCHIYRRSDEVPPYLWIILTQKAYRRYPNPWTLPWKPTLRVRQPLGIGRPHSRKEQKYLLISNRLYETI